MFWEDSTNSRSSLQTPASTGADAKRFSIQGIDFQSNFLYLSHKVYKAYSLQMKSLLTKLSAALCFIFLFSLCTSTKQEPAEYSSYSVHKRQMDSIAINTESLGELETLASSSMKTGDETAAMAFYRELGKRNRDSSDFQAAIFCHNEAVTLSKNLKDTVSAIMMLNQLGTDYRRINAHDLASDCYYEAIRLSDEYSGEKTTYFVKNSVASLNGLGNIFKDIQQEENAEELFRRALQGEEKLGNHLGMAINTANLGSICEHRGQLDSAMWYYRRSFEENTIAGSAMGIALCYNHFGRIQETKGQLDSAMVNYQKAYTALERDADKWHWLSSCISLARVNHAFGKNIEAERLLDEALETAYGIDSWYHLSEIYDLRAEVNKSTGDWKDALDDVNHAVAFKDSLEFERQTSHVQALQSEYLEQQNEAALQQERLQTASEKHKRNLILWISIVLFGMMLAIVLLLVYAMRMRRRNFEERLKAESARQDFFTTVTHDFRTPLTVILGQANLILSRNSEGKDSESARAIIRQSDILMELINQILDISKVKTSVGVADWRRGNILPLITMTVENARLSAAQKNINLYYSHSPELDGVEIDFVPDFVKKIFSNILSNAVKYTKEGGDINVEASLEGENFIWKVSDTGIGISKNDIDKIFTPFFRSESIKSQSGNGIGLSIVKQMVEAMNGSISVSSTPGEGSTFSISFPAVHFKEGEVQLYFHSAAQARSEAAGADSVSESADNEREDDLSELPILLIIEDNDDIAAYIKELFKDDCQIRTAMNGRVGLSMIEECVPDLIITDLMMPDIDGFELCRRVRASELLNHIPIVVVTAKDREADRLASIEAGADAVIIKPFNAQELTMTVRNLFESRRLLREKFSAQIKETEDMDKVAASNPDADRFLSKLTSTIISDISAAAMSPDFIADKLCMTPASVNRKVKSLTGMSTSAFITATRISMAKKLLSTTSKTVGEISDQCGFEYQSYFNRIFKNNTGFTPAEYRNRSSAPDQM